MRFTPVLALYDPFGVDVPLNLDNTHSLHAGSDGYVEGSNVQLLAFGELNRAPYAFIAFVEGRLFGRDQIITYGTEDPRSTTGAILPLYCVMFRKKSF